MQNIASWIAADCMAAPRRAIAAVTAIPHLRPHLSASVPAKGVATTEPRKTTATLSEVVAVVKAKYSVYDGRIWRPFWLEQVSMNLDCAKVVSRHHHSRVISLSGRIEDRDIAEHNKKVDAITVQFCIDV